GSPPPLATMEKLTLESNKPISPYNDHAGEPRVLSCATPISTNADRLRALAKRKWSCRKKSPVTGCSRRASYSSILVTCRNKSGISAGPNHASCCFREFDIHQVSP